MTLNTLILGFEVSIVVLLFALCWQLSRHYRAFFQKRSTANGRVVTESQSSSPQEQESMSHSLAMKEQYLVEETTAQDGIESSHDSNVPEVSFSGNQSSLQESKKVSVSRVSANSEWQEEQSVKSNAILNDYIDGFFSDSSAVSAEQLASFKAEPENVLVEQKLPETKLDLVVDDVPVLQPILLDETSVEDEDSFIMVEESSGSVSGSQESTDVMSDKVVLAMLKEAKTACS